RAGRTASRHRPGPGVAGDQQAQPGRLPVHRPAGRAGQVADAGHPPPAGQLTRKAAARIPRARSASANGSDMREGSDQPARQEAFMAIAIRTAQTTWEGPLASGTGTVRTGSGATGELPVTWATRTERADGETSPEELAAA